MKMKWISTLSALAIVGTGCIAAVPAIINNQSNVSTQETDANQIVETNNIKHSKNVQLVNEVDQIVVEDVLSNSASSAAIVNNNGKQEIYVWGENKYGQLGLGDVNIRHTPTLLDSSKLGNYLSVKEIIFGTHHNMTIIVNTSIGERIYVCGANNLGQLGIGNKTHQLSPVLFDTSQFGEYVNIKEIHFDSANKDATFNSYAILSTSKDGDKIFVWGSNDKGQLGLGDTGTVVRPTLFDTTQFGSYKNIRKFVIGYVSYAIIEVRGYIEKLFTWGDGSLGQMGLGSLVGSNAPVELKSTIFNEAIIKSVESTNYNMFMVLTRKGVDELYAWGSNNMNQIGNGKIDTQLTPYKIPQSDLGGAAQINDINISNSVAVQVRTNGIDSTYVWGYNHVGQLGLGDTISRAKPTLFDTSKFTNFIEIYDWSFNSKYKYSDSVFAYVKTTDGDKLFTWGNNKEGQLGQNSNIDQSSPKWVPNITNYPIKKFNTNMDNAITLTMDVNGTSRYFTTGKNTVGNLGTGDTNNVRSFTWILPIRYTKPQVNEYYPSNLTSSQALDLINHNNVLDKNKLADYVDLSTFPADATLSVDPLTTTSDYENGILNLGIKTDKHDQLMVKNTTVAPETFNVKIDGFTKATSIDTNPVVTIQRYADNNTIDTIYDHIVDSNDLVVNRELLEYYFNLSSIPPTSILHLYRTSFGNNMEATFKFTSSQVYDSKGMVANQEYTNPDLLLKLNSTSPEIVQAENADNLGLIISLSVVGALLLISLIVITVMLMKRKHY